jgi:polyisoprenoid-binding protein YceI
MSRWRCALPKRVSLLALLLLLPLPLWAAAGQAAYHIQSDSSQAVFRVRLLWLENVSGHFTRIDGDVAPGPLSGSWVVNATIPVDSVTMPSSRMRKWLLAPSFFDAEHHPTIQFVSDPIALTELDRGGTLSGNLTLRGVTAPIHFAMEPEHCAAMQDVTAPCRIQLRGSLRRSTFGMTSDRLAISDSVDLNLSITLQRETR